MSISKRAKIIGSSLILLGVCSMFATKTELAIKQSEGVVTRKLDDGMFLVKLDTGKVTNFSLPNNTKKGDKVSLYTVKDGCCTYTEMVDGFDWRTGGLIVLGGGIAILTAGYMLKKAEDTVEEEETKKEASEDTLEDDEYKDGV